MAKEDERFKLKKPSDTQASRQQTAQRAHKVFLLLPRAPVEPGGVTTPTFLGDDQLDFHSFIQVAVVMVKITGVCACITLCNTCGAGKREECSALY